MSSVENNKVQYLLVLLAINYAIAVCMVVGIAIMTLWGNNILFQFDTYLYGPLANNLNLILVYLALIEIPVAIYCYIRNQYSEIVVLGFFFIMCIGSLEFYSRVNQIPLENDYQLIFSYIGLSHIVFGIAKYVTSHKRHYS